MPITLITGGNKSLGHETARRLLAAGHSVWIGARDCERGQIAASELNARLVQLDVTDDASVASAARMLEREAGGLDVLINNAGISGGRTPVPDVTVDDLRSVYETNVFGPVRVMQALAPLLLRSACPVVVNVSSGMGSLAVTTDPARLESTINGLAYPSSKTALNMLTSQYAKAYPGMRINAVDPGYTATDLNDHRGSQSIETGATVIVAAARLSAAGPTGTFFDAAGPVPW